MISGTEYAAMLKNLYVGMAHSLGYGDNFNQY
jgi:hypothetical protein